MPPQILYNNQQFNYQVFNSSPDFVVNKLQQIHSSKVVTPEMVNSPADGFIMTSKTDQHYAIVTADCMPIIIQGELGIGFVHAGWQGVKNSIISPENFSSIRPQHFFIGPHIHSCCYEVSEEFKDNFPNSPAFSYRQGKLYFSLEQQQIYQIKQYFPLAKIESSNECTCCTTKYHSYRRNKTTLRNWNIIYY